MIQYDETRLAMEALTPQIEELRGALNLDGIKIKLDELEMKSTEPSFWDDPEKSQAVLQQIGQYKNTIENFNRLDFAVGGNGGHNRNIAAVAL